MASGPAKSMNMARLGDILLGSVGSHIPPHKHMNHAVRYLSTWSGSDKFFMVIQYTCKLLAPYFLLRAQLQHKAGKTKSAESFAATALTKLGSNISNARTLSNFWGLLPIIQWLSSLERSQPQTRKLLNIERLQALAMLAYYPLEHAYYLGSQSIIRVSPRTSGKLAMWSCRIWALYIVLQFGHLREDMKLLAQDERAARAARKGGEVSSEATANRVLVKRKSALWNQLLVNIGNFPLALHWSLEKGLFGNETWVNFFGLIAALASFRAGWSRALCNCLCNARTERNRVMTGTTSCCPKMRSNLPFHRLPCSQACLADNPRSDECLCCAKSPNHDLSVMLRCLSASKLNCQWLLPGGRLVEWFGSY